MRTTRPPLASSVHSHCAQEPRCCHLPPRLTYLQAIVIGIVQGVTELFPISSLGHSVLLPELLGWDKLVTGQSADESFYLAFLVGLHVATAIALLIFFWRDWVQVIKGFFSSIRKRRIDTLGRANGVAARGRNDPGRHRRARVRAQPPHHLRETHRGGDLPHHQRSDPLRRRTTPPPRRGTQARAHA